MWIGRADGAGWTFPRATVLAIPLLCCTWSADLASHILASSSPMTSLVYEEWMLEV